MAFNMGNQLGQAYAKLRLDTSDFNRKLKSSQRKFQRSSGDMRGRAKKLGRSMKKMGMMAAAGAAAVGTAAVKMANSFGEAQKEAQQVFTLMDVSEQQFQQVREEISDLSEEYGIMQTEGLEALYQITSATYKGEEATRIFAQAAKSGIAGATDQKTAADALTTVMNAYGKSVDEVESVSDTFFQTVRRGKTTFPELAKGISKVTSIAPQMKVNFEEVGAALATLTRAGQDTSEAVTNLGRLITEIGVKPADRLIEVLNEMGYAGESAGKKILAEKGLYGAIQEISGELDKQGKSWDQMLKRQQAMRAALILTGKGAKGFARDMELMDQKAGSTSEAFSKMTDTFWFKKKQLTAAFDDLVKSIGSKFAPAMTDLIENEMLPAIEEFDEWVGGVEGTKQKLTSFFNDATRVARGFFDIMTKIGSITVTISNWTFKLADAEATLEEKIKAAFGVGAMVVGGSLVAVATSFGLPGIIAGALITGWAAGNVIELDPLDIVFRINLIPDINIPGGGGLGGLLGGMDLAGDIKKQIKQYLEDKNIEGLWHEAYKETSERKKDWGELDLDSREALKSQPVESDLDLYDENKSDIEKLGEKMSEELRSSVGSIEWEALRTGAGESVPDRDISARRKARKSERAETVASSTRSFIEGVQDQWEKIGKPLTDLKKQLGYIDKKAKIFGDEVDVTESKMSAYRSTIEQLIEAEVPLESEAIQQLKSKWEALQDSSDNLTEKFKNAGRAIRNFANTLPSILQDLGVEVGTVMQGWLEGVGQGMSAMTQLLSGNTLGALISGIQAFASVIGGYNEKAKQELREFRENLRSLAQTAKSVAQDLAGAVTGILEPMLGPLSGAIDALVGGIFNAVGAVVSNLQNPMQAVLGIFEAMASTASGLVSSFMSLIQESKAYKAFQKEAEPLWKALSNAMSNFLWPLVAAVDALKELWGITDDVSEEMGEVTDLNIAEGFKRTRTQWEAAIKDQLPTTAGGDEFSYDIPEWAKSIGEDIAETIDDLVSDFGSTLGLKEGENVFEFIERKIQDWWEGLDIGGLGQLLNPFQEFLGGIDWQALRTEVEEILDSLGDLNWEQIGENLSDFLIEGLEDLQQFIDELPSTSEDGFGGLEDIIEKVGEWIVNAVSVTGGMIVGAIVGGMKGAAIGGAAGWGIAESIKNEETGLVDAFIEALKSGGLAWGSIELGEMIWDWLTGGESDGWLPDDLWGWLTGGESVDLFGDIWSWLTGWIPEFKWAEWLNPVNWWNWISNLDWATWLNPLNWYNWITDLNWLNWLNPLNWVDWVSNLSWSKWLNPLNWIDWVSNLNWIDWINPLNWGDWINPLNWGNWLSNINWPEWINPLNWGSIISDFNWGKWINPLNWGSWIGDSLSSLGGALGSAGSTLSNVLGGAGSTLMSAGSSLISMLGPAGTVAAAVGAGMAVFPDFRDKVLGVAGDLVDGFGSLLSDLSSGIGDFLDWLNPFTGGDGEDDEPTKLEKLVAKIKEGSQSAVNTVKDVAKDMIERGTLTQEAFQNFKSFVENSKWAKAAEWVSEKFKLPSGGIPPGGGGDDGDGGNGGGGGGDDGDGGNGGGGNLGDIKEKIRATYFAQRLEGTRSLEREALNQAAKVVQEGLLEAVTIRDRLFDVVAHNEGKRETDPALRTFMENLPELQVGGTILGTGIAEVHEGEWIGQPGDFAPSGTIVIDNTLNLDGKEVYENQKQYKQREAYQKSGSSTGGGHGRE